MSEQKQSQWKLVKVSDLPVPSANELEELRRRWIGVEVAFFVGSGRWQHGRVYQITKAGEVKIEVWRNGAWVHGRVIRFEYISRVLRVATGK